MPNWLRLRPLVCLRLSNYFCDSDHYSTLVFLADAYAYLDQFYEDLRLAISLFECGGGQVAITVSSGIHCILEGINSPTTLAALLLIAKDLGFSPTFMAMILARIAVVTGLPSLNNSE